MLNSKISHFETIEQEKVFRGKFELEFLLKMIKEILKDSYEKKEIITEKINFSFGDGSSLNQQQILNIFAAYAETPESLLEYLKRVLK